MLLFSKRYMFNDFCILNPVRTGTFLYNSDITPIDNLKLPLGLMPPDVIDTMSINLL